MNFRKPLLSVLLTGSLIGAAGRLNAGTVMIDDFNADEGHFVSAPGFSGSNRRVAPHLTDPGPGIAPSTADRSALEFFEGSGSQKLVINRETNPALPGLTFPSGPGEWFLRHVSGATPGSPASNTPIPNTGNTWVGYWLKTTSANIEAGIIIDDTTAGGNNHEIAVFQPILGDGMWHLYQFELANPASWELFAGAQPDPGAINGATVTIDSLAFRGATGVADSVEFHIDAVVYNPDGPITVVPEPSALTFAGLGALALLRRKR